MISDLAERDLEQMLAGAGPSGMQADHAIAQLQSQAQALQLSQSTNNSLVSAQNTQLYMSNRDVSIRCLKGWYQSTASVMESGSGSVYCQCLLWRVGGDQSTASIMESGSGSVYCQCYGEWECIRLLPVFVMENGRGLVYSQCYREWEWISLRPVFVMESGRGLVYC